jgi:uncharacterized protein (DUF4415 family)
VTFPSKRIGTARGAAFFRPVKKQLTLRLDADLVDWFKSHAPNGQVYQTVINSAWINRLKSSPKVGLLCLQRFE